VNLFSAARMSHVQESEDYSKSTMQFPKHRLAAELWTMAVRFGRMICPMVGTPLAVSTGMNKNGCGVAAGEGEGRKWGETCNDSAYLGVC